jgi:cytochrome c553
MKMFRSLGLLAMLLSNVALASDHGAATKDRSAQELIEGRCKACHGTDGKGTIPTNPTIGGQHRSYLEHALTEYHEGKRKNGIMGAQAKDLTKAEIKALAVWYSQQKAGLYVPSLGQ